MEGQHLRVRRAPFQIIYREEVELLRVLERRPRLIRARGGRRNAAFQRFRWTQIAVDSSFTHCTHF
jgi:hypothetical protein